jgi:hypothetical protein
VDAQRGDVLAVENLSFQELPMEIPAPAPTKVEHWRRLILPWRGRLRYLGVAALFLVVYVLILRPVKKQALTAFRELPGKAGCAAGLGRRRSGGLGCRGGGQLSARRPERATQPFEEDADRESESRARSGQPPGASPG